KPGYLSEVPPADRAASLAWSAAPEGPYTELWHYDPELKWKDGTPINRTLRWPEVFHQVRSLPAGTQHVYVRYRINGMALDNIRLAAISPADRKSPLVEVTQLGHEGSAPHSDVE